MTGLMDPNRETHLDKEGKALHQLTVSWLNVNVIRNICLYPVIKTTLSHELLSASKQHRNSPLICCRVPRKRGKKKAEIRLEQRRAELLGCKRVWGVIMRVTKLPSLLSQEDLSHSFCVYHFLVADGAYVQTDAFPKLTLSRSANQRDSDFVASSRRSHTFTLAVIDKDNHFLCSIGVSDPMWPKTTNQQKLSERIIRCIVYLFFAYRTITRSRLMVQFYAVKPGASGRTDNISVWPRTQLAKILQQTLKGLLIIESDQEI